MRTKNIQSIHSLRQMISLFLSIALPFVVINQIPARVIATSSTQSVPMLNGTLTAVNNTFGSQSNPPPASWNREQPTHEITKCSRSTQCF